MTSTGCDSWKFSSASNVKVVVHTTESKATSSELTSLYAAMGDIDATIGQIGGDTTWGPRVNCIYNEAQIVLPDFDSAVSGYIPGGIDATVWNLGTPGVNYYDALAYDSSDTLYLRPIYLHELMHAFGLHHSGNSFAMMNYGTKAWANRPDSLMMQPLPDDAAGLRALYPASTTRYEVAVLNNWYTAAADPRNPANDAQLCMPNQAAVVLQRPHVAGCRRSIHRQPHRRHPGRAVSGIRHDVQGADARRIA